MRAADFSWEAPPSLVKTSTSSTAFVALQLRHKCHSVPPNRVKHLLPITVRGRLPQSFHSPQLLSLTRFTLIYPFVLILYLATAVPISNRGMRRRALLILLSKSKRKDPKQRKRNPKKRICLIQNMCTNDLKAFAYGRAAANWSTSS